MRKILALLVVTALGATTPVAIADPVEDMLDELYLSASTNPQIVSTQARGGIVGGSAQLRAPIRSINLVTLSAPRFNAGCGGLDLFMGSFSYINADNFVQMLRTIGANALGLAFQIGLKKISPTIADTISEMQEKIQSLNQMFRNTCQVAKLAVDEEARNELKDNWEAFKATFEGDEQDAASNAEQQLASPGKANARKENPYVGNMTWIALTTSDGEFNPDKLGIMSLTGDDNRMREYLMSLLGTVITQANAESGEEGRESYQEEIKEATLSLHDFMSRFAAPPVAGGGGEGRTPREVQFWACQDGFIDCQVVATEPFDFDGFEEITHRNLNRIIEGLESDANLTEDEQIAAFLNATKIPALYMLSRFSYSPEIMRFLKNQMAPVIAEELLLAFGEEAMRAGRMAFTNVHTAKAPDLYHRNMEQLYEDIRTIRGTAIEQVREFNELMEMMQIFQDRERQRNPQTISRSANRG